MVFFLLSKVCWKNKEFLEEKNPFRVHLTINSICSLGGIKLTNIINIALDTMQGEGTAEIRSAVRID